MLSAKTRWKAAEADPEACGRLVRELAVHPVVARMLVKRGLTDPAEAARFLRPRLEDLHDPFLMDGMEAAVKRIRHALENKEKILVYGDYDADGVTSTSLMMLLFRRLGADVDYYIPNRFREGYGLNKDALDLAAERGFQLVVTVDTGISAVVEAKHAQTLGLDLIITDHHEPPAVLPEAVAVINPKKPGCPYPFKSLSGVGVAFKLATALLGRSPEEWLDIVALGTISDLVALTGENRVFAAYGLKRMSARERIGIRALLDVAGIDGDVKAGHVAFALGPRINASGRLDSARLAAELLLIEDAEAARAMAEELDAMNRERQQLVEEIAKEAISEVERDPEKHRHVIVVAKPGWNIGVIGIVASRLVEKYYRPVIVLSIDEEKGVAKGSARSIDGFDMYKALTDCKELLPHYGGHYMAAGMTLPVENVPLLQERLSELARTWLKPEDYIPLTVAEAELTLDEIESDWVEQLAALEPYGMGNPTPLFIIQDARLSRLQLVGAQQNHLKLQLQAGERTLDAVGFRLGELAHEIAPQAELKVLGELQMNEWNGRRTPQLIVRDLAVPHLQVFDWRSNRFHHDGWAEQIGADAVCFRSQASSRFGLLPRASWRTVFWEEIEGNEWVSRAKGSRVAVVADPPPSLDALVRGLNACADTAERLYFLFGDAELDDVLVRMPTRDEFKRLYQVLKGKNGISLHKHLSSLMRVTGLQKRALSFMIQVFEELGFLEVRQGEIHLHPEPRKRALTESKRYQSELDRQQVLHTLVYSSYKELCHFLFSTIAFKHMGGNLYELQREDPRDSRLPAAGDSL